MTNPLPDTAVIEVFKPGTHTSNAGDAVSFSAAEVQAIASAYDPAAHDAPVVVGHPKDNAPAYGWVKGLRFDGQVLKADLGKLDPAFAELVRAGRYRRVSASFYSPASPQNPKPGGYYLRHVGFLGAQPPAIKGLKAVEFSGEADTLTVEFGEDELERLRAENERLRAAQSADFSEQLATAQRQLGNDAFLNGLVAQGKPLPKGKVEILDFMDRLNPSEVIEFSEGSTHPPTNALEFFKSLLSNLPKQVEFAEMAGDGMEENFLDGAQEQARRIGEHVEQQRAKGRTINFSDALSEVTRK